MNTAARIPPLPPEQFAEHSGVAEAQSVRPQALDGAGSLNVVATFGHHPDLMRALTPLGGALREMSLPLRDRELIILRIAHHDDCRYEWEHHRRTAAAAGLTAEEVARLRGPLDEAEHTESDAALLAAVDELAGPAHRVGDDTWARLAARYDTRQLLEVLTFAGLYNWLAWVLNSCDTPLEDWLPAD